MWRKVISMTGLVILLFSKKVIAHPHSFIALQTEVIAENGQFVGLKMRWAMDEMTSADLLYDAGNASADSVVWKTLADEVMENVRLQNYFTEVWHDSKKELLLEAPGGWKLERENHRAIFSFMLQLAVPQPLTGQSVIPFLPSIRVIMWICIMKKSMTLHFLGRCLRFVN